MGGVVLSVLTGLLPIYIAAICGALLMVLTGCLTMDDAYRSIEWRAVFLIERSMHINRSKCSTSPPPPSIAGGK